MLLPRPPEVMPQLGVAMIVSLLLLIVSLASAQTEQIWTAGDLADAGTKDTYFTDVYMDHEAESCTIYTAYYAGARNLPLTMPDGSTFSCPSTRCALIMKTQPGGAKPGWHYKLVASNWVTQHTVIAKNSSVAVFGIFTGPTLTYASTTHEATWTTPGAVDTPSFGIAAFFNDSQPRSVAVVSSAGGASFRDGAFLNQDEVFFVGSYSSSESVTLQSSATATSRILFANSSESYTCVFGRVRADGFSNFIGAALGIGHSAWTTDHDVSCEGAAMDSSNSCFVIGRTRSPQIMFNSTADSLWSSTNYGANYNDFVLKLHLNGSHSWIKWFSTNSINGARLQDLMIDSADNLYVHGWCADSIISFDGIPVLTQNTGSGIYANFVFRISSSTGVVRWGTAMYSDSYSHDVFVDFTKHNMYFGLHGSFSFNDGYAVNASSRYDRHFARLHKETGHTAWAQLFVAETGPTVSYSINAASACSGWIAVAGTFRNSSAIGMMENQTVVFINDTNWQGLFYYGFDACTCDPCANLGTCLSRVSRFECVCAYGWTGDTCEDIDECASAPCHNGGTCIDAVNSYTCACPGGYQGILCETNIDECASTPCLNGGTCNDGVNSFTCTSCNAGYSGTLCEVNIDECASTPCHNGGTCNDGVNSYTCTCAGGYQGILCGTNIEECVSAPCQNGGTCNDGVNSFTCTSCNAGYSGTLCEVNIDECASSPCQNGGTCNDGVNSFTCTSCSAGYSGTLCEVNIDECISAPCQNDGTCNDGVNSFTCTSCNAGYSGTLCEVNIDECASAPCHNGGTCNDGVNSFTCTSCNAGYSGTLCEVNIDECVSTPCHNGGTCNDGVNSFTCTCAGGYRGILCETNIEECVSAPCHNGGTCNDGVSSFTCTCGDGYGGILCELVCKGVGFVNPCGHGGCVANPDRVTWECSCDNGWIGSRCGQGCEPGTTSPPSSDACDIACVNCAGSGACYGGTEGLLCDECAADHYMMGSKCHACSNTVWLTLLLVLVVGMIVYVLYKFGAKSEFRHVMLRVLTHFVQLGAIGLFLNVAWPPSVYVAWDWLSFVNIDINWFHPECVLSWDYYSKLIAKLCTAAAVLLVLAVVDRVLAYRVVSPAARANPSYRARVSQRIVYVRRAALLVVSFAYAPVVGQMIGVFQCVNAGTDSDPDWQLLHDDTLPCYTEGHTKVMWAVGVVLPFLALGLPLALFIGIWRLQRAHQLRDVAGRARWGFLFELYCDKMPWFEAIVLIRKLGMLLGGFQIGCELQCSFCLVVCVAYLVLVLWRGPYLPMFIEWHGRSVEVVNLSERTVSACLVFDQVLAVVMCVSPAALPTLLVAVLYLTVNGLVALALLVVIGVWTWMHSQRARQLKSAAGGDKEGLRLAPLLHNDNGDDLKSIASAGAASDEGTGAEAGDGNRLMFVPLSPPDVQLVEQSVAAPAAPACVAPALSAARAPQAGEEAPPPPHTLVFIPESVAPPSCQPTGPGQSEPPTSVRISTAAASASVRDEQQQPKRDSIAAAVGGLNEREELERAYAHARDAMRLAMSSGNYARACNLALPLQSVAQRLRALLHFESEAKASPEAVEAGGSLGLDSSGDTASIPNSLNSAAPSLGSSAGGGSPLTRASASSYESKSVTSGSAARDSTARVDSSRGSVLLHAELERILSRRLPEQIDAALRPLQNSLALANAKCQHAVESPSESSIRAALRTLREQMTRVAAKSQTLEQRACASFDPLSARRVREFRDTRCGYRSGAASDAGDADSKSPEFSSAELTAIQTAWIGATKKWRASLDSQAYVEPADSGTGGAALSRVNLPHARELVQSLWHALLKTPGLLLHREDAAAETVDAMINAVLATLGL